MPSTLVCLDEPGFDCIPMGQLQDGLTVTQSLIPKKEQDSIVDESVLSKYLINQIGTFGEVGGII